MMIIQQLSPYLNHRRIQYFTMEGVHVLGAGPGKRKSPVGSRGKAPVGSLGDKAPRSWSKIWN